MQKNNEKMKTEIRKKFELQLRAVGYRDFTLNDQGRYYWKGIQTAWEDYYAGAVKKRTALRRIVRRAVSRKEALLLLARDALENAAKGKDGAFYAAIAAIDAELQPKEPT